MRLTLIFLFLFFRISSAQNLRIDSLLQTISSCQRTYSDSFYTSGLFPSKRVYLKQKNYKRDDDNIFFTGLIVWTLRSQRDKLNEKNKIVLDSICAKASYNFPLYRNKYGDCTYNFWQPKPGRHFPNDRFFSKRKKHALPDDLDDTAVIYLADNQPDSLKKKLKDKMALHANGNGRWIHNTFRKYKHRRAYNTWFGRRMRVDFDLSVHCNAMRWILDNNLELNQYDHETINLIQDMVLAGEHIENAHYVSPHYQLPSIVLYHLSKLVSAHPAIFPLIKNQIINDLQNQLKVTVNPMEKLLMQTSLARFGIFQKAEILSQKDFDGFYYFVANMTSVTPNPIKGWFAKSKVTNFYYRCEGFYWCLLLENECLNLNDK